MDGKCHSLALLGLCSERLGDFILKKRKSMWKQVLLSSELYQALTPFSSLLCSVAQSCLTLCDPMDCSPPGSSCPWKFSGQDTGVDCHFPPSGYLPDPGIETASLASPALAGRFFTTSTTDLGWSLGWEDPLEEGMATHSSSLAWRIQWTEEPGGLQSVRSQRVGHD